jgi:hypothetical protein
VQFAAVLLVALHVSGDLSQPVFLIGGRHAAPRAAVPMPKAAVDENGKLGFSEHYVRIPDDILNVRLKAYTGGM